MNAIVQDGTVTDAPEVLETITGFWSTVDEPTAEEAAEAQKFADYVTKIKFLSSPVTYAEVPERAGDPSIRYRFATRLAVVPAAEEFVIGLRVGATEDDLEFAERELEAVRAGHFAKMPFEVRPSTKSPGEFLYVLFPGRLYVPRAHRDRGEIERFIIECREPACEEFGGYHTVVNLVDDSFHEHVAYESMSAQWSVRATRESSADRWAVTVIADWIDVTPDLAMSLANDLKYAAAEVARLNATAEVGSVPESGRSLSDVNQ